MPSCPAFDQHVLFSGFNFLSWETPLIFSWACSLWNHRLESWRGLRGPPLPKAEASRKSIFQQIPSMFVIMGWGESLFDYRSGAPSLRCVSPNSLLLTFRNAKSCKNVTLIDNETNSHLMMRIPIRRQVFLFYYYGNTHRAATKTYCMEGQKVSQRLLQSHTQREQRSHKVSRLLAGCPSPPALLPHTFSSGC